MLALLGLARLRLARLRLARLRLAHCGGFQCCSSRCPCAPSSLRSFVPSCTGGTDATVGFPSEPYHLNGNTYGGTGGGINSPSCSGAITATLTWQPDQYKTLQTDPAPPAGSVIIVETCTATALAITTPTGTATAKCDDGFGLPGSKQSTSGVPVYNTATPPQVIYSATDPSVTDTRYTINGGAVISLPAVNASASASVSPYEQASTNVSYTVNAYPVSIIPGGATKDSSGNWNILVGQNCAPYLSIPGLPSAITVGWPTWTVSGDTFTSFDIGSGQSTGQAIPFPDPNANISVNPPAENPTFFWKDSNGSGSPETISASAILYTDAAGGLSPNPNVPPSAEIGAVSASAQVQVYRPDVYSTPPTVGPHGVLGNSVNPQLGTVGINTGSNEVISNDPSGNSSGYYLQIAVVTPDLFTQGGTKFGNWGWLQLCQLNITQGGNGTQMAVPELDSSFPYNNTAGVANGVPGPTYGAQLTNNGSPAYEGFDDSPSEQYYNYFLRYDTAFSFDNNFHLYVMYEPPDAGNGVNYVPVDMYQWEFEASMTRPGLNGLWTPNPPGSVKDLGSAPYPNYPTWTSQYSP